MVAEVRMKRVGAFRLGWQLAVLLGVFVGSNVLVASASPRQSSVTASITVASEEGRDSIETGSQGAGLHDAEFVGMDLPICPNSTPESWFIHYDGGEVGTGFLKHDSTAAGVYTSNCNGALQQTTVSQTRTGRFIIRSEISNGCLDSSECPSGMPVLVSRVADGRWQGECGSYLVKLEVSCAEHDSLEDVSTDDERADSDE